MRRASFPKDRRRPKIAGVPNDLDAIFAEQGGVATSGQLLRTWTRSQLDTRIARGDLLKVWPGIYCRDEPDDALRLSGLDLRAGEPVAICLGTAAAAYGFDTEQPDDLHVLNPARHQLRNSDGLVVHRREGAPLSQVGGRPATTAEWTAIEVARGLRRPRALATLDLALRSGSCDRRGLLRAAEAQAGRRGIVVVRELLPHAAAEAESPMESEARLAMIDAGLPSPELQFEVIDRLGRTWRLDFAWPDQRLAVEYDGFDWHSDPESLRRDRQKRAALQDLDWSVISVVSDDVRRRSWDMVRRIGWELERSRAA
jgi:very-short-patch-repair endonuclease